MANRPKGFGMTAELAKKKAAKFDADLANEAITWILNVLDGENSNDIDLLRDQKEAANEKDVHGPLKNGVVLCELVNIIRPGSVKKINHMNSAFKQMENIGLFLDACSAIGCKREDLFQTVDLFESTNIPQVVNGIFALGRKVNAMGTGLPRLGPEESIENKRQFSEAQLKAGEGIIGLQAGSNKGASQAGQNFGKTRAIID